MIAFKKNVFLLSLAFITSLCVYSQEKGDIGLLYSTDKAQKLGIEYRTAFKDKYKFKIGATMGNGSHRATSFFSYSNDVVMASDSIITTRLKSDFYNQFGIRVGAERKLGASMFTLGADVNVDYRIRRKRNRNHSTFLDSEGWAGGTWNTEANYAQIKQHYLVPSLRLSLNLEVPINQAFLLNVSAAANVSTPIYMGATEVTDPLGEFIGTPRGVIDMRSMLNAGIRYNIGAPLRKKK